MTVYIVVERYDGIYEVISNVYDSLEKAEEKREEIIGALIDEEVFDPYGSVSILEYNVE